MDISREECRKMAETIFRSAVESVLPENLMERQVSLEEKLLRIGELTWNVDALNHIYVIGAGKASANMAGPLERLLGDRITDGVIIVKYEHGQSLQNIRVYEAGHPVVDSAGIEATQQMLDLLGETTENDLVICLISGGGSALLERYAEGIDIKDGQRLTELLLQSGAAIGEVNTVRKHISRVKGGQLARHIAPAEGLTLLLSDVIGDPLDVIASGPTVPDTSTYKQAMDILKKYNIVQAAPPFVRQHIEKGVSGEIPETPKAADKCFRKMKNVLIGTNRTAIQAAMEKARELQLHPFVLSTETQGEAREVAKQFVSLLKDAADLDYLVQKPACFITGGETTVTIQGTGKGGRNQEFALAAAMDIQGMENIVVLSGGTDGTDGPTDAAGGMVDGRTVQRALELKLEPQAFLENNDSYPLLQQTGDLLMTGPTRTNVMDIMLGIVV